MDYPLPTTDISASLVRDTLGESTTNIGALCTSPNINMWSRRKPVRDPRVVINTYSDIGKGADGMCGLILPPWEGNDTLLTYYAKPRGAGGPYSEPYRLGDFRGYIDKKILPITILPKPASIPISTQEGGGVLSNVYTNPQPGAPVVTLQDIGMQLCSFYYEHSSQSFIGWSPSIYFNLGQAQVIYLDVKFGLIPTAQAVLLNNWYTTLPGSGINIYELPRENTTQNKNWVNVVTSLPSGIITNWNVILRRDLNRLEYSILAGYSFNATLVIKEQESGTTIYQFNVYVTADVPTSGYKSLDSVPYPIEPSKTYITYLYDGPILKDSRPLTGV